MRRRSVYAAQIESDLRRAGLAADPRLVEAYMRLEHGCLDSLSEPAWRREVLTAVACIEAGGVADAEALAASFGL